MSAGACRVGVLRMTRTRPRSPAGCLEALAATPFGARTVCVVVASGAARERGRLPLSYRLGGPGVVGGAFRAGSRCDGVSERGGGGGVRPASPGSGLPLPLWRTCWSALRMMPTRTVGRATYGVARSGGVKVPLGGFHTFTDAPVRQRPAVRTMTPGPGRAGQCRRPTASVPSRTSRYRCRGGGVRCGDERRGRAGRRGPGRQRVRAGACADASVDCVV